MIKLEFESLPVLAITSTICFGLSLFLLPKWGVGVLGLVILGMHTYGYARTCQDFRQYREMAYKDRLTGLENRAFLEAFMPYLDNYQKIGVISCYLHELRQINEAMGRKQGDRALIYAAQIISESTRKKDMVIRWDGARFLVVLPEASIQDLERVSAQILAKSKNGEPLNLMLGTAYKSEGKTFTQMIEEAESKKETPTSPSTVCAG